jgi:Na+-transporting methylmalonyl-CoA/oxaloacetate decarboxylase gamma subunit
MSAYRGFIVLGVGAVLVLLPFLIFVALPVGQAVPTAA